MTDQNTVQTYHLKLSFSQYEKSYLMEHLTQYSKKIQRHLPKQTFTQDPPFMTSDHRLLQFESTQTSLIPAYDSFLLDVKFWHTFQPSQLCFTAKMSNLNFFPNAYCLLHQSQTDVTPDTLLALDTSTGTHLVPSHLPPHEVKPLLIYQLSLNIHLEQLQYSLAPYNDWHQIETEAGHLNFPTTPSVNFSQLPPIQNKHFQPVLPQLPRAVHFPHRRSTQHHQNYDPYQDIQDLRNRQTTLFQLVHQQPPPPVQVQQQCHQPAGDPVNNNQNSASNQSFSAMGAHHVPPLADELHKLTESLHAIEARQANNGAQGAPTTQTPRLTTVGRGRTTARAPLLPPGFADIHEPSQPPSMPYRLQPRPIDHSSPRERLHPSHPSSLNSDFPASRIASGNTPSFQTPAQVREYWRQTGQEHFFDDTRPPGVSEDDPRPPGVSEDDFVATGLSSNPQPSAAVTYTSVTVNPSTATTDAVHIQSSAQTVSVPVQSQVTNSVHTPVSSLDPNSLQTKPMTKASNHIKPKVSVQNEIQNEDVLRNIEVHRKNTENLNKLSEIVIEFPSKNQFKDFSYPDPTNNDFKLYKLPDYLRPYVADLLLRINTSTSNFPSHLFPYIQFESKLNRFVALELNLDLTSLQKLDHLVNKDKAPSFLTKLTDKVNKKRNKSNEA